VRDVLAALGSRRVDWVLATEPTELRVVHRHKGVVHVRLEAQGRACHASEPEGGRNAIVALARATVALDALAERLADRADAGLGPPTLSVGRFEGGHAPNVVPDHAQLVADRRLLPEESVEDVAREIEEALAAAGVSDAVRLASCRLEKPALGTPADHPAVQACLASLRAVERPAEIAGVAFGTDAGVFALDAGMPGVVMGPGSIRQAHTAREWVALDQVDAMTAFFVDLLTGS
jgi:acetylornithine deacetylase